MEENWLTAIFNKYLAGPANSVLTMANSPAKDPAHPWATWLVMELLVMAIIVLLVTVLKPKLSADKPGKLQHMFETLYEFLITQARDVGVEHPEKYVNWFGTVFIFILVSNLLGALPILESPTMTVYVPAALAACTWVYYHAMGLKAVGPVAYLKHFGGPILFLAPLMFFIEVIGHMARILSMTVRLYGNMYAGEQLINVFIGLTYVVVPALFMGLHVFVAFLQAYVFTLLTMIYVSLGTAHEH
jgi:F-type H+-transporting ATPase subunit a